MMRKISKDASDDRDSFVERSPFRSAGSSLSRPVLWACLALFLLYVGSIVRQEQLKQMLVRAMIANRDEDAMAALEQGADAKCIYEEPSDVVWWRRMLALLPGRHTHRTPGISLLALALEHQPTRDIEFVPPTPGRLALMEMLVKKGSPVNVRDHWGETPLEFAVRYDSYDLAVCLLDHGADVNMPGSVGVSILDRAIQKTDRRIFLLVLDRGADINRLDSLRFTPLHWARDSGHDEYVQILLERHAKE